MCNARKMGSDSRLTFGCSHCGEKYVEEENSYTLRGKIVDHCPRCDRYFFSDKTSDTISEEDIQTMLNS